MTIFDATYAPPTLSSSIPQPLPKWSPADEYEYRKLHQALALLAPRRQAALSNLNDVLRKAGLGTHGVDFDNMLSCVRDIFDAMKPFDVNDAPQVQP